HSRSSPPHIEAASIHIWPSHGDASCALPCPFFGSRFCVPDPGSGFAAAGTRNPTAGGGSLKSFEEVLALFPFKNRRSLAVLAAIGLFVLGRPATAHDIPADSTVRMFVKPEGQRLHVLVRVQMASINDIDWPLRRPTGYLDLAKVEPFL